MEPWGLKAPRQKKKQNTSASLQTVICLYGDGETGACARKVYTGGEVEQLTPTQRGSGRAEHKPLHVVITAGRRPRAGLEGEKRPGHSGEPGFATPGEPVGCFCSPSARPELRLVT